MKERSYKIALGDISITATYFGDGIGECRREPLGEMFDNLSRFHHHAEFEIFFLWGGEMELVTERENLRFSDSAVILPHGLGHYTVVSAERLFVIYMSIDRAEGESGKRLVERLSSEVLSLDIGESEKFYLEKLSVAKNRYCCPHLLSLLFSELLTRLEPRLLGGEREESAEGKYAFALEEYIEHHYSERIRLADVAKTLHLCEKQVSRVIKKEYGCTFSDYVNQKRLSVAMMMLKHTEMTVGDIAHAVGFESDNYFYRVFKEKYGMTPSEYRVKQKNGS